MSKLYLIISITLSACFWCSCVYDQSAERFKTAWQKNDSIYVKQFINSLDNKSPEEVGVVAETILSEYTNFGYGMMFFPRKEEVNFWDTIPKPKQEIIKYNIINVWLIYVESDLFLKKDCIGMIEYKGEKTTFHEVFHPHRNNKFLNSELLQIKSQLNRVASNCK